MKNTPLFEGVTEYTGSTNNYNNTSLNCPGINSFGSRRFGSRNVFPTQEPLGLPAGAFNPTTLNEVMPDPNMRGNPLPRPYGPRDNLRMGTGNTTNGFGATPGSSAWNQVVQNVRGQEYANAGVLKSAKGYMNPEILYYQNAKGVVPGDMPRLGNVPMQYSDNALNTPLFNYKQYGSKKKSKKSKKKKGKGKKKSSKKSRSKKQMLNMFGPNNVGYEAHIPIYHGGGNTVDFFTDKLYNQDIVGGPTNSTGPYASVGTSREPLLSVVKDGITPNQYSFGANMSNMVYSPDIPTSGTGLTSLYQEAPDYLTRQDITGNYVSYGSKKSIKKQAQKQAPTKTAPKQLMKSVVKQASTSTTKSIPKSKHIIKIIENKKSKQLDKPRNIAHITNTKSVKKQVPKLTAYSSKGLQKLTTVYDGYTITIDKKGSFNIKEPK